MRLARRMLYPAAEGGTSKQIRRDIAGHSFWASRFVEVSVEGTSPVTRQRTVLTTG